MNDVTTATSHFEVNGDNTILDKRTNLIWSRTLGKKAVNFKAAEKLVAECREGGFDDWRMPTDAEILGAMADSLAARIDDARSRANDGEDAID